MFARIGGSKVVEVVDELPVGPQSLLETYQSIVGIVPQPQVGWTVAGGLFYAPVAPVVSKPTTMSPLEFFGRFTDAETASLHTAALSNAMILGFLLNAAAAQVIDLTDPRLKAGLDALVTVGLLAPSREAVILTP